VFPCTCSIDEDFLIPFPSRGNQGPRTQDVDRRSREERGSRGDKERRGTKRRSRRDEERRSTRGTELRLDGDTQRRLLINLIVISRTIQLHALQHTPVQEIIPYNSPKS